MFDFSTSRWFQSLDGVSLQKVGKLFGNPVDVKDSVEMIDFMLEDYCCESADSVANRNQFSVFSGIVF